MVEVFFLISNKQGRECDLCTVLSLADIVYCTLPLCGVRRSRICSVYQAGRTCKCVMFPSLLIRFGLSFVRDASRVARSDHCDTRRLNVLSPSSTHLDQLANFVG